jgi:hypothetical protein
MKKTYAILGGVITAILSGCSSPPAVVQAPVGPNPFGATQSGPQGTLEVFSATVQENNVGYETPYYERTSYDIYDGSGNMIKRVRDNNRGEYRALPLREQLAPGTYKVKALAAVGTGEWLMIPVVIDAGKTTEVHLNGHWTPPNDVPGKALVYTPQGRPLGYSDGTPN